MALNGLYVPLMSLRNAHSLTLTTKGNLTLRHVHLFTFTHVSQSRGAGDESLEFVVGTLMQIVFQNQEKYTAHNSPKHAISSENSIFCLGRGVTHSRSVDPSPTPRPPTKRSGFASASFQNSSHRFTPMYSRMCMYRQHEQELSRR